VVPRLIKNWIKVYFFTLYFIYLSFPVLAHDGLGNEIGLIHTSTSFEHLAGFVGIGALVATIMLVQHSAAKRLGNMILVFFLSYQIIMHTQIGGVLFGLEVFVAGTLLALGSWRLVFLLFNFLTPYLKN